MQVTLDIPEAFAAQIIASGKNPTQAALEALAVEGYRAQQLSEYEVQQMLGLDTRMQVHAFLKEHGVYLNFTLADLEQDRQTIAKLSKMPVLPDRIDGNETRKSPAEAVAAIRELRKGNRLKGLKIADLIQEGRRF